jgi:hypothetical protein
MPRPAPSVTRRDRHAGICGAFPSKRREAASRRRRSDPIVGNIAILPRACSDTWAPMSPGSPQMSQSRLTWYLLAKFTHGWALLCRHRASECRKRSPLFALSQDCRAGRDSRAWAKALDPLPRARREQCNAASPLPYFKA